GDLAASLENVIGTMPAEQADALRADLSETSQGIGAIAASTHSGSGLEASHEGILATTEKIDHASELLREAITGIRDYLTAIGAAEGGQSAAQPTARPTVRMERSARPMPTRVNKLEVLPDGSTQTSPASPEASQVILESIRQLRQRAKEIIPNRPEPPEVERINQFFEKQGLSTAPVVILTPDEVGTVVDELVAIGFYNWTLDELGYFDAEGAGVRGAYVPMLDTCFVVREPRHQKASPEFLSTVAHEKAHSTSLHTDLEYTAYATGDTNYRWSRVGHILTRSGSGAFLEEGFAEFMAAKFVREELGLPNGMWPNSSLLDSRNLPSLPPVYVWLNEQGKFITPHGAPAAYALELLTEQRLPDLPASLIKARTSAQGLLEVKAAIETVEPGLHDKLCALPGDGPAHYVKGFRMIQWQLMRPHAWRSRFGSGPDK
ncbi:MAG TPA: hypothetical protein VMR45_03075, partial [Patescibacteria group bacterium]|nr:hypothetical protein [Patescibacteria group bacterium]